jgi:hypothetical protein
MWKLRLIAFIVMLTAPLPAFAYTQQDAAACASDAQRLCQDAIPDESLVATCLHQNRRLLSPACNMTLRHPRWQR